MAVVIAAGENTETEDQPGSCDVVVRVCRIGRQDLLGGSSESKVVSCEGLQ